MLSCLSRGQPIENQGLLADYTVLPADYTVLPVSRSLDKRLWGFLVKNEDWFLAQLLIPVNLSKLKHEDESHIYDANRTDLQILKMLLTMQIFQRFETCKDIFTLHNGTGQTHLWHWYWHIHRNIQLSFDTVVDKFNQTQTNAFDLWHVYVNIYSIINMIKGCWK